MITDQDSGRTINDCRAAFSLLESQVEAVSHQQSIPGSTFPVQSSANPKKRPAESQTGGHRAIQPKISPFYPSSTASSTGSNQQTTVGASPARTAQPGQRKRGRPSKADRQRLEEERARLPPPPPMFSQSGPHLPPLTRERSLLSFTGGSTPSVIDRTSGNGRFDTNFSPRERPEMQSQALENQHQSLNQSQPHSESERTPSVSSPPPVSSVRDVPLQRPTPIPQLPLPPASGRFANTSPLPSIPSSGPPSSSNPNPAVSAINTTEPTAASLSLSRAEAEQPRSLELPRP